MPAVVSCHNFDGKMIDKGGEKILGCWNLIKGMYINVPLLKQTYLPF